MTFQPVLPLGGLPGWTLLTRTLEQQQAAHDASPLLQREEAEFREKIASISSAEELVSDRSLLKVALGAFGLGDDLQSRFFIQKVLEEGVLDPDSLANKLSDPRYAELSEAFGFGDYILPRTVLSGFPEEILSAYRRQSFEVSVGDINPDMRLALGLERDLASIMDRASSDDGRWFLVMGSPAVRSVFETALGLPESFQSLDIDVQLSVFRERASQQFGVSEVSDFLEAPKLDELRRNFLVRSEIVNPTSGAVAGSSALSLLTGGGSSSSSILATLYGF